MGIGIWQILLIAVLLILLFGRGKISGLMGDVAQGIKSFRKGMKEDGEEAESKDKTEAKMLELEADKTREANARKNDKQRVN